MRNEDACACPTERSDHCTKQRPFEHEMMCPEDPPGRFWITRSPRANLGALRVLAMTHPFEHGHVSWNVTCAKFGSRSRVTLIQRLLGAE